MQHLETRRLTLRPMAWEDWEAIAEILQDAKAMYAYEHPFSCQEVDRWLHNQIARYEREGVGLWAAVERQSGRLVGQAGITWQDWEGRRVPEIGYLFNRAFWHQGYATEAAVAWKEYGFTTLGLPALYSIIRDNNAPSQRVAVIPFAPAVYRTILFLSPAAAPFNGVAQTFLRLTKAYLKSWQGAPGE